MAEPLLDPAPSADGLNNNEIFEEIENLTAFLTFKEDPQGLDEFAPTHVGVDDFLADNFNDDSRISSGALAGAGLSDCGLGDGQGGQGGRRRRRIRNAKQQELNRLAQQRYRQRKKQKAVDLQSAVEDLSTRLHTLATLQAEVSSLKKSNAVAQAALADKDTALAAAQERLRLQAERLREQEGRIGAQEAQLAACQAELSVLRMTDRPLPRSSGNASCGFAAPSSPLRTGYPPAHLAAAAAAARLDPQMLCEQLLSAFRAALSDVVAQHGAGAATSVLQGTASPQAHEAVMASMRRSLSSCCRELIGAAAGSAPGMVGAAGAPAQGVQPAGTEPAAGTAIPCF
mmetsp:Transcript_8875/g.18947  ORF Transcript_8875/g.18947 Transcript_8875/m.18947 type:complete len:343 (-) Transcript_8875:217-1245(-)|eukprot:CAMPEP_0202920100 /NCGR_PEP_ID=MMETSP1392-20130828/76682_1 /ASSEMBLY_ACC=CAM_ASM_000868 /TAXON_ID=225041 /ORGANISM="Chlamydomonas chlamydogama, Strain SAG 11-48b" /LENGTH=342 /DNA_ID=CAMNT_0049613583 /DNA_START=98 /DNA_END=1126 /DNA_ORIENTATION=+